MTKGKIIKPIAKHALTKRVSTKITLNENKSLGKRLIEGIREIKAGGGKENTLTPPTGVRLIRARMGLSQSEFARRLNISVRTLQEWEQGKRKPSGAAMALLNIAYKYPKIFMQADIQNPRKIEW